MVYTIQVPNEYGYVILATASTIIMNIVQGTNTGKYRRAAKIAYPAAYASAEQAKESQDAYLFNCAQRSHANFTENHVNIVAPMLICGLQYPVASAILGLSWSINRYLYMTGYTSLKKEGGMGRYNGLLQHVSTLGFLGLSIWMGVQMVLPK